MMDYGKLKISELKALLKDKGLKVGGNKAVLIERLKESTSSTNDLPGPTATSSNISDAGLIHEPIMKKQKKAAKQKVPPQVEITAIVSTPSAPPIAAHVPTQGIETIPSTSVNVQPKKLLPPSLSKFTLPPCKVTSVVAPPKSSINTSGSNACTSNTASTALLQKPVDSSIVQRVQKSISKFKPPMMSNPQPALAAPPRIRTLVSNDVRAGPVTLAEKVDYIKSSCLERIYAQLQLVTSTPSSNISLPLAFDGFSPAFFASSSTVQFVTAARVITHRLYLAMSFDFSPVSLRSLPVVIGAEQIVEGIWRIHYETNESAFILEYTGEVLGTVEDAEGALPDLVLREDWRQFLDRETTAPAMEGREEGAKLIELIMTNDSEEYKHGLSRRLNAIAAKGMNMSDPERKMIHIARRFVFAHCDARSISGTYETVAASASIYSSLPTNSSLSRQSLGFYLPPPLCVESVHMLCAQSAIVQTVGQGGLIVLRETGQSVGNEQDGIVELWREILQ